MKSLKDEHTYSMGVQQYTIVIYIKISFEVAITTIDNSTNKHVPLVLLTLRNSGSPWLDLYFSMGSIWGGIFDAWG